MIQRNILFLIFFLTFLLSACSLKKQDVKNNNFQKEIKTLDNKIPRVIEEKEKETLGNKIPKVIEKKEKKYLVEESNIPINTSKQNKLKKTNNEKKVENSLNLKNKLYINFAAGYSSLKSYDVYNTSTNEAIWDDRYTKLGRSFEIGLGYDFGKLRTEITYAQETGRFDEYLTYFDNSITKIDNDRGKLQKDFYLINSYYDFRNGKKISPFIGLGLGFVNSSQDSAPFIPKYERQVFVLQLKGGFSFKISEKNYIYLEGFYRDSNSHTTNDGLGTPHIYEAKDGFDSSGLQIGIRKII
jgi:opacity protein-like surface antigen